MPRLSYRSILRYLEIIDFLMIQAVYIPDALDVSPSLDHVCKFVMKAYLQYIELTKENEFSSLRSQFLTIKSWSFFSIMEKSELQVTADIRLYFNLKGKEQARDKFGGLISDKIFHQYLGTNYTLEMLRNNH